MKEGKTLAEITDVLEYQRDRKRDFVCPNGLMTFNAKDNALLLEGIGFFSVSELAHDQIAGRLEIPRKYYDRMREKQPDLLETNVNAWLKHVPADARLVRTLDGSVRAFLSDKYRPLDHIDLLDAVVPTLQQSDCRIESADITDTRLYLKAVSERVQFPLEPGHDKRDDIAQAGLCISNSEVGCGSLSVEPLIWRRVCSNGLIIQDHSFSKYHVGRGAKGAEQAFEFFRDETRLADDRAFWMKVRDTVGHAFEAINFGKIVDRLVATRADVVEAPALKCIEVTAELLSLSDREADLVGEHYVREHDYTRFGVLNAITRAAQDVENYDRSTDMERLGARIMELPKRDWDRIARAH